MTFSMWKKKAFSFLSGFWGKVFAFLVNYLGVILSLMVNFPNSCAAFILLSF